MKRILLAVCGLILGFSASRASAEGDVLTADEIARHTLRADAFGSEGAKTLLRMVLLAKDGKREERSMEVMARKGGGQLQTLVRFSAPQDLAGTAFLMREQAGGAPEQYVYLSGLKRTRRIVGREREGSFMGSDFTYADMQRVDAKYSHNQREPDEKLGDAPTYVIESSIDPQSGSPYGKIVTWVRKSDFVALRTRFFDKAGKLVKTLYARKVRDFEGKPVVVEALMKGENGHATELFIDAIERRTDLADAMFTPGALEHM
jgi:hypothetical protein